MTDFPRRSLVLLVALVPILVFATLVVVLVYDLSWYSGLAIFYISLAVAEFGYLGLLILAERWLDRAPAASLGREG